MDLNYVIVNKGETIEGTLTIESVNVSELQGRPYLSFINLLHGKGRIYFPSALTYCLLRAECSGQTKVFPHTE